MVRNMTEKLWATFEALGVFLVSVLPLLLTILGDRLFRRRRRRAARTRDPP